MSPLEKIATTTITRRGMNLVANCCDKPAAYLGFSLPTLWGEANMARVEHEGERRPGDSILTTKCTGCETEHQLTYHLIDRFYNELFPIQPPEQRG